MTFMQAIYGSQYYEISQKGKDGAKGRFNGNILLSAFVILIILTITGLCITFSAAMGDRFNALIERTFGAEDGKGTGRLLAIPLMAVCYLVVCNTVGTEKNYNRIIEAFNLLPVDEKNRANKKILVPFFVVLAVFFITAISYSH